MRIAIIWTFILVFVSPAALALQPPILRLKLGNYTTQVTAGEIVVEEALGSMVTLQPTVLWDLPSFRARLGVHFLLDFSSEFGMTPISGTGFSGYFYPFGLSSYMELDEDGSLKQISKPGPFVTGSLTPVNFNMNRKSEDSSEQSFAFSAFMMEIMLGAGYDYPIQRNMIISLELAYRSGSAPNASSEIGGVEYSGIGVNFSFMTSYY